MAERIGIVHIDSEDSSRQFVRELAKNSPSLQIAAEASDLGRGYDLVRQHRPGIVILDLYPSSEAALLLAERIFQQYPQTVLIVTTIDTSPDLAIRAMRAGVREFLSKPLRKEEVENALRSGMRILSRMHAGEERNGKVISVFGVKGGVGATTVAANLAVNLSSRSGKDVLLVDANLQFGNAALFLNLKPRHSLVDVAMHVSELDPESLRQSVPKHDTGVGLLAAPLRLEDTEHLTPDHVEHLIGLLRATYDYIIVDLPKVLDDTTVKFLDSADAILTVMTADIPSISNALRCLDAFRRLEYGESKVFPVLNRYDPASSSAVEELQKTLKYPLFWKIPNQDYATIIGSINQGIPLGTAAPKSPVSQSLAGMADRLNGSGHGESPESLNGEREGILKRLLAFRK